MAFSTGSRCSRLDGNLGLCFTPTRHIVSCATCRLQHLVENGPHPPAGETGAKYIIRDVRF